MAIFLSNFINSDINFAVTEDFPVPGGPCKAITVSDSISRKLADHALLIYNKIGCRHYARVDFLLSKNSHYLLEINTLPGLTATSLLPKSAAKIGLPYHRLVEKIIELAFLH